MNFSTLHGAYPFGDKKKGKIDVKIIYNTKPNAGKISNVAVFCYSSMLDAGKIKQHPGIHADVTLTMPLT